LSWKCASLLATRKSRGYSTGTDSKMADTPNEDAPKPSADIITVKLVPQAGEPLSVKAKSSTKLGKLRDAYAKEKGIDPNILRFVSSEGSMLGSWEMTLGQAGLKDDDEISVMLKKTGGKINV